MSLVRRGPLVNKIFGTESKWHSWCRDKKGGLRADGAHTEL